VEDLLADDANGIDVVFHNPCTPAFTYRIQGRNALYHGGGDFHEATYDNMVVNASLLDLQKFFIIPAGTRGYRSTPSTVRTR
jgi:hypothetical protein